METDFFRGLFNASLDELKNASSPFRYNSFAYSFRALTRNILERLAPDEEIRKCQWYKNETEKPDGVSRKQRMLYAIRGGLSDEFINDKLDFDLNTIPTELKVVIDDLSKYTHIEEATFNIDSTIGDNMVIQSISTFDTFLETIQDFKRQIIISNEVHLYELIDEALISETIQEIDELASHYQVEESSINDVKVLSIDEAEIAVTISGEVHVQLQYGSDSDYKSGDGLRVRDSYPFDISLIIDVKNPFEFSIDVENIEVDNSKFHS